MPRSQEEIWQVCIPTEMKLTWDSQRLASRQLHAPITYMREFPPQSSTQMIAGKLLICLIVYLNCVLDFCSHNIVIIRVGNLHNHYTSTKTNTSRLIVYKN